MKPLRAVAVLLLTSCFAASCLVVGAAATRQLPSPKNVVASATSTTSISLSFSSVPGATSYTAFLYGAAGKSSQEIPNVDPSGTSIAGLSVCTSYRVSVQAISSTRGLSSVQSGKVSIATQCNPALVPAFATATSTADGFTVQITNYDPAYSWSGSVTSGSVELDGSGLATVSGLTTDATVTLTVSTARANYDGGSATVSGARSSTPVTPSHWIGSGDFTIELWVKPTVNWVGAGRQELFAITPSSLQGRLDVAYMEGGNWAVISHMWSTPPESAAVAPPPTGQWTHIAVTRQSGTMSLYVAGQRVAESSATADFSSYNELILGADPNSSWCNCNLAKALLSNVRIVDGTALYTGSSITIPTGPLAVVSGTTFVLNNALGDSTVGSVELDGTTRYQQGIRVVADGTSLSPFTSYLLNGGMWQVSTVKTSTDSPFSV